MKISCTLQHLTPELPAYVMIPRMVPGTNSAYLGAGYKPFETLADPAIDGPFKVPNFQLVNGVSVDRLADRSRLLQGFDALKRDVDRTGQMKAMDRFQQQAWGILSTDKARDAFDLDAEPRTLRERYGYMPRFDPGASNRCGAPAWSQRILLARRLIEAGVRLVTVDLSIGISTYGAGKGGGISFMRNLALEVARNGVTANCIALGLMNNVPKEALPALAATIPVGRAGDPDEIGACCVYLASAEASWMTGQTLQLNGGSVTT